VGPSALFSLRKLPHSFWSALKWISCAVHEGNKPSFFAKKQVFHNLSLEDFVLWISLETPKFRGVLSMSISGAFPFVVRPCVQTAGCAILAYVAYVFAPTHDAVAQCCGQISTPVMTQTYRLDYKTVYEEEKVTAYRVTYKTVYDDRVYTVQKPVWETQTQQRRYTVQKPVWETQTREERYTVMKPVYETKIVDQSYNVVRDVVETGTREERYTVMKPVYETSMQEQVRTVRRPVYETAEREETYTVAEPVTTTRTAYSMTTQAVDTVTPVATPGTAQLGWSYGGWAVNPYTGRTRWQRGGYTWAMTPGVVVNQVNRVYQPTYTPIQVPQTTMVNRVVSRRVPVQTVRYVDEQVVQQVPVQTMRMVAEQQVRQVPVQTVRKVVERVENKVPVQTVRMVAEEQVRQIPVQVCRYITEERVQPVNVQVCKYVTEQQTVKVPRIVENREPISYTVRKPRTVITRIPLDACGNPIHTPPPSLTPSVTPSNPAAPPMAPAAAARPTLPAVNTSEDFDQKTFSDSAADVSLKDSPAGWGSSDLEHIDPESSTVQANKPVTAELGSINEEIDETDTDTFPENNQPTPKVAPLRGPSVEPGLPAGSTRDIPADETSSTLLQPSQHGKTT